MPFGPFDPVAHRTFEIGLRAWVEEQAGLRLGYVEQLYTFGDRGRHTRPGDTEAHVASIGYLALTRGGRQCAARARRAFRAVVPLFPVGGLAQRAARDHRPRHPARAQPLGRAIRRLTSRPRAQPQGPRAALFRRDDAPWDEERVLDRYELLYEAGLVEEALRDGRPAAASRKALPKLGVAMRFDHRRILATAIARLRGKTEIPPGGL